MFTVMMSQAVPSSAKCEAAAVPSRGAQSPEMDTSTSRQHWLAENPQGYSWRSLHHCEPERSPPAAQARPSTSLSALLPWPPSAPPCPFRRGFPRSRLPHAALSLSFSVPFCYSSLISHRRPIPGSLAVASLGGLSYLRLIGTSRAPVQAWRCAPIDWSWAQIGPGSPGLLRAGGGAEQASLTPPRLKSVTIEAPGRPLWALCSHIIIKSPGH